MGLPRFSKGGIVLVLEAKPTDAEAKGSGGVPSDVKKRLFLLLYFFTSFFLFFLFISS